MDCLKGFFAVFCKGTVIPVDFWYDVICCAKT